MDWLVVAVLPQALERFPPEQVPWAGPHGARRAARDLEGALADMQIEPVAAEAGQSLALGEGARLRVLAATERGTVLLEWNAFHSLLPIGIDFETLKALQAEPGRRSSGFSNNQALWAELLRPTTD